MKTIKVLNRARILTAILAGALICLFGAELQPLTGQQKSDEAGKAVAPSSGPKKEEPLVVSSKDIEHTILITGELKAERSRDIQAPRIRSGFASSVTYLPLEGTAVKAGQRIVEFDASNLLTQKIEYERQLDEAKLNILKTKAGLDAARTDLVLEVENQETNVKVAKLYADIPKELLPANDYQKYQLQLEQARLALGKAKEKLANHDASRASQMALAELTKEQEELDLKRLDGDIKSMQIDAPQDGIVIYGDNWANNRKVQVGDNIFPGMTVISLPDLSSLQVIGYVYDTELRSLAPGMRCELRLDAVPGKSWRGAIQSLTSVATRKGFATTHKVFRAVIQPENLDLSLMKPGMTVRIEVPVSLASGALAIPREYLGLDRAGKYYVVKGADRKTASHQFVSVGAFNERLVQILSGVQAGDRLLRVQETEVKS